MLFLSPVAERQAQIGQQANDPRTTTESDPQDLTSTLALPQSFVVSRGGECFIVPSIKALKETFAISSEEVIVATD